MSTSTGEPPVHDPHQPYDGPIFPIPGGGDGPSPDDQDIAPDEYPISTWVLIDDVIAPCDTDDLRIGTPTVMDGLSFGWGRETAVDQPGSNTCTFTIREELDPRGLDENQIEDPDFADPDLNAARFPAEWPVDGGEVEIGGPYRAEQILATNFYPDPSQAYGLAPYASTPSAGTGTIELATDQVHSGSQSIKMTCTSTAAMYRNSVAWTPAQFGLVAGDQITFSTWVRVAAATSLYPTIYYLGGTGITPLTIPSTMITARDTWIQVKATTTVTNPAGSMFTRIYGGNSNGSITWFDDAGLAKGTEAVDFNGDTADTADLAYRWTGTAGASTSQKYVPAIAANADSYRVWLIGDKQATASSSTAPAAPAPDNGAIPVVAGETFQFSVMATANPVYREVRWQVGRYDADGAVITSTTYVGSNTPLQPGEPTLVTNSYTIPDDGTAYIAVAFVCEGTFNTGTVTISQPAIAMTDSVEALDDIHVGSTVEVWSRADVPATDAEVMDSTGFEAGVGNLDWTRISGGDGITMPPPVNSFQGSDPALWFIKPDVFDDWSMQAAFAPKPFVDDADTGNLTAWDLVPKLAPGVTWLVTADVYVPPGTTATLKAWAYAGPHKADLVGECTIGTNDDGDAISVTGVPEQMIGASGWYTIAGTVTLPADLTDAGGYWICPGIEFATLPSPLPWDDPAAADWTWDQMTLRWIDLQRGGLASLSLQQAAAAPRTVLIWAGEVTDLRAQAAGDFAYTISVTASDLSSIMQNVKVGDEPWPMQTLAERAAAIMALIPQSPPLIVDDTLQDTMISYRDVDSQAPLGLLQDLAQSAGGVLWITAHATEGAYLWMEDPRNREAVRRFVIAADGTVSISTGNDPTAGVAVISAMDILRDPVQWVQDTSSVITQATVTWMEQVPPEEEGGETTTNDVTEIVQDTADVIARYGVRDVSVGTELTSAQDAEELAARLLALSRGLVWKADGLQYDTLVLVRDIDTIDYPARLTTVLDLLDATIRIGYPFTLIDAPAWTPAAAVRSMYVEGGTYTWEGRRWTLDLTATPSAGQGQSARWEDFDGTGVTWEDFRPNKIRWLDAYGTAGPDVATQHELEEVGVHG